MVHTVLTHKTDQETPPLSLILSAYSHHILLSSAPVNFKGHRSIKNQHHIICKKRWWDPQATQLDSLHTSRLQWEMLSMEKNPNKPENKKIKAALVESASTVNRVHRQNDMESCACTPGALFTDHRGNCCRNLHATFSIAVRVESWCSAPQQEWKPLRNCCYYMLRYEPYCSFQWYYSSGFLQTSRISLLFVGNQMKNKL